MIRRQEKPPEHMANSLYLEWFSDANGRVVVESADYEVNISPPEWRLTLAEEEQRAREAGAGMEGFLTKLNEFVFEFRTTAAKLAGALANCARGCGSRDHAFTVAYLKRALDHLHRAQAGLEAVAPKCLLPPPLITDARQKLFAIREGILRLMRLRCSWRLIGGSGLGNTLRMQDVPEPLFRLDDFIPALREIVRARPFDATRCLHVAVPVKDPAKHSTPVPAGLDRRSISFTEGTEVWSWEVDSLRALFRGNKQPPVLGDYPTAYNDAFAILDLHALEISNIFGDRRDAEMREIYSALRRRPDGRSLGFVHDYLWQAAALVLGTRPLSQAEFEAIMERLERSCHKFELGSTSRNYVSSLRQLFGQTKQSAKPSGPDLEDAVDRLLQRMESGEGSWVEPELSALYAKHPRHHLTNYAMGTYQAMVAKDAQSAASYFEVAVQLRPDFAEAHFNLGSAAQQKADILKAVESFRRAERYSDGEDGIAEMARNALRRLEEIALKTGPFRSLDAFLDSARLFNRAYGCLAARQFEQAIDLFQRVLAGDPKHVQSYGNMALAYAGLGRRSEAMACFDRALELDPKYEPARLNRQRLAHMREGEPCLPEAIEEVEFYADQHWQA